MGDEEQEKMIPPWMNVQEITKIIRQVLPTPYILLRSGSSNINM